MSSYSQKAKDYGNKAYDAAFKNKHLIVMIFGIIFIIIAIVGLIALWGAQTGSSQSSGIGSLVLSSTSDDGTMNSTTEVVAEFLIVMFTILGIGMLTYVWVVDKNVKTLVNNGQTYGAILVAGNKKITPEMAEEAKKDQLKVDISDLNLPSSVIDAGLKSIKQGAAVANRMTMNAGRRVSGAVSGAAAGYNNANVINNSPPSKSSSRSSSKSSRSDEDDNDSTK